MTHHADAPPTPPPQADEERQYRSVLDLDPAAPGALEALLQHLDDASWRVRSAAVARLAAVDPAASVPALVAALGGDASPGRRNSAAAALVAVGPPAVRALCDALDSPCPEMRTAAAEILGDLGDRAANAALALRLADGDANARVAAAEALGKLGGAEAAGALERSLATPDAALRRVVLDAMGRLRVAPAVARLGELAGDRGLRRAALRLAGSSDDPAALALLVSGLEDGARGVREAALAGLGLQRLRRADGAAAFEAELRDLARRAPAAVEAAVAALGADDLAVQAGALAVLRCAGAPAHAAAIVSAGRDDRLRPLVAEALDALGPAVAPFLSESLPSLDPAARANALSALARLGEADILPELLGAASGDDEAARASAIEALGRLGDPAGAAVLMPLLDHSDAGVSGAAVAALAQIAARSPTARACVLAACRARAVAGSPALFRLLGRVGDEHDAPALRAGLADPHRGHRVAAAAALGAIASRAGGGRDVPELLAALDDVDPAVRASAAQAVGAAVAGAAPSAHACRALAVALRDEEATVRAAAALALGRARAVEYAGPLSELAADPAAAPEAAAAAVHALAEMGRADAAVLARAARHRDPEVVKEAVLAAARLPGAGAAVILLGAATHARWDVRRTAARALEQRGDPGLAEQVRRLAAAEDDALVAEALGTALRALEARG